MKRSIILAVSIALLVSGLLLAKSAARLQKSTDLSTAKDQKSQTPDAQSKNDSAPAPNPPTPKIGSTAPNFSLANMKGDKVQLSSFKGKAVVLDFWATWCEPCKLEMPWMVDLQKKYGPQGLQIIGVAMDDADDQTITEFARKMGVNYPLLRGTEAVADLYGGLDGLPSTFFLDRSGKIVDEGVGLMSQSVIEDSIKHALEGTPAHSAGGK